MEEYSDPFHCRRHCRIRIRCATETFIKRFRLSGLVATALAGLGWLVSAGGLYWLFLRRA
jgi:hypothetical protein